MQLARKRALSLFMRLEEAYDSDPERWASTKGTVDAVARVAMTYSLKQLSMWLARGSMAQGSLPPMTA